MIFKVFISVIKGVEWENVCKVLAVENGQQLENRIAAIESNLKADGFKDVILKDCVNISEPTRKEY